MSTTRRFYAALGANVTGQMMTVAMQLASVPVFLHYWSLEQYGQWLILTAIPTYFALADVGFLAVTINKMTMVAAAGDRPRANVLFQTAIKLCIFAVSLAVMLSALAAGVIQAAPLDVLPNKFVLVALVLCSVLGMSSGLIDAAFRSSGEFALGTHLINVGRLLEWAGMLVGLLIGGSFLSAALGQLTGRACASLIAWKIAERRHPHLRWGVSSASREELRELVRPALSFMAFPVGNAISIQGMTLIVGHLFGAPFLAVFSTYRTITRTLVQGVTVIGRSLWPEISRRFGAGDIRNVISIYKKGTLASVCVAGVLCTFMFFCGELLLRFWTSGRIPYESGLFRWFLLATTLTSIWQMGMIVLSATNRHFALSMAYVFGATLSVLLSWSLAETMGRFAPMAGMIGFEIFLIVVCAMLVLDFRRNVLEAA